LLKQSKKVQQKILMGLPFLFPSDKFEVDGKCQN